MTIKYAGHLGYAIASLLENLLISEKFISASGPRRRYRPSRQGVNDEGLRGRSFSPCLSSSRSLIQAHKTAVSAQISTDSSEFTTQNKSATHIDRKVAKYIYIQDCGP